MITLDRLLLGLLAIVVTSCGGPSSSSDAYRESADGTYHAELVGKGFEAQDGKRVYAVTWAESACRAEGWAVIERGEFTLLLENEYRESVYPVIFAFVDVNENGQCDRGIDLSWNATGNVAGMGWTLSANEFQPFHPDQECIAFDDEG